MSQRFQSLQDLLQNPWGEHQDPPRPSAVRFWVGWWAQPWGRFPELLHRGKGKIPSWYSQVLCWAGHEPKFAFLSPWDFYRERKEGSKQSRAPGISQSFTFPHLIHQISGFCPKSPGILREGEQSHFSELFLQVWDWGWALTQQNLSPACRSWLLAWKAKFPNITQI